MKQPKNWRLVCLMLFASLLLTACGIQDNLGPVSGGRVETVTKSKTENTVFIPENGTEEEKEITKLCILSVSPNSLLQSAIDVYQETHPEIKVTLGTMTETAASQESRKKAAQELNDRILSGEEFDVLVAGWLDWHLFAEKGLLADLTPRLQSYLISPDYYGNILGAYEAEGKHYAAVVEFQPLLAALRKNISVEILEFDGLEEYLKAYPQDCVFVPESYRGNPGLFAGTFYCLYREALLGQSGFRLENCLEEDRCKRYLTAEKEIWDRMMAADGEEKESAWIARSEEVETLAKGKQGAAAFFYADSVASPAPSAHWKGLYQINSGRFYGNTVICISQYSKNREQAEFFLETLLSEEVQKAGKRRGLSINKKVMKEELEQQAVWFEEQGMSSGYLPPGGTPENTVYPLRRDEVASYLELYRKSVTAVPYADGGADPSGDGLYERMREESVRYLSGDQTLEETVHNLMRSKCW